LGRQPKPRCEWVSGFARKDDQRGLENNPSTATITITSSNTISLSLPDMAGAQKAFEGEQSLGEVGIHVSLTYDVLDATKSMARVKSPKAGAVVLFAGTYPPLHIIHTSTHTLTDPRNSVH
jgi:hypothetical protein